MSVNGGGSHLLDSSQQYENQQQFIEHQTLACQRKVLCYIGGLSTDIQSIEEICDLCTPFGTVVNVTVPRDIVTQKHRGFCFVEFSDPTDAKACIDNLHGSILYERTLIVNYAKPTSIKFHGHTGIDTVSYEQYTDNQQVSLKSAFATLEQAQNTETVGQQEQQHTESVSV